MKKQGKGFLAGVLTAILVIGLICIVAAIMRAGQHPAETGYNNAKVTTPDKTDETPTDETPTDEPLQIGQTWTVPDQWEVTVTSVEETQERNPYDDKTPAAVYIIDYTYTNLGYEDSQGIMDGLFISFDNSVASTIIDSDGVLGYSYPGTKTYYPQETPVGATCNAQACVGVDHPGDFTIQTYMYDSNMVKQSAVFALNP